MLVREREKVIKNDIFRNAMGRCSNNNCWRYPTNHKGDNEMSKEKRMYSLNLAAYVMMITGIEPNVGVEYGNDTTLCYLVFPECEAVAAAIAAYRADNGLHSFLNAYAELREILNDARA